MDKGKIFEVELSRWNPSGANPSVEIALPATPYELAECYEHIAAHGLKGAILLEKHRQKMEQNQEMKLSM